MTGIMGTRIEVVPGSVPFHSGVNIYRLNECENIKMLCNYKTLYKCYRKKKSMVAIFLYSGKCKAIHTHTHTHTHIYIYIFFETEFRSCYPGWSAMA